MKCPICDHEQHVGNFCIVCGNKFTEPILHSDNRISYVDNTISETKPPTPNVHIENMNRKWKTYRSYFMQQLKKPSLTYTQREKEFTNSLINIFLFIILFSLSKFLFTSNSNWGNPPIFSSFFIEVLLGSVIAIGIVCLSLYTINSFFGPQHTFKTIVNFYGGQLSPFIVGAAISLLFMLAKSFSYGNIIISVCVIVAIFILPLYIISNILTQNSSNLDPLYRFILYIVLFTTLFVIIVTFTADSTLFRNFNNLSSIFY